VLEDCYRRPLKFANEVSGGRNINDVVEAELLALQLFKHVKKASVKRRFLMWIFTVAKVGCFRDGKFEALGKSRQTGQIRFVRLDLAFEVTGNRAIVGTGASKHFGRQLLTQLGQAFRM